MARTPNPITQPVELPELPEQKIIDKQNEMSTNLAQITEQFGDGLLYERTRVVNEAKFFSSQSAEAMLELGKRLILIKENEPHGEFVHITQEQLNIGIRTAQKMMQAAIKYLSPSMLPNTKTISHLGSTKLFELMVEDDEEISALANGGTVANLTLEDTERMSVRELKAALKKAKEDAKKQLVDLQEDNDAVQKRNADLSKEKEELALKLAKFELKIIPLDERLTPFKNQVVETQSAIDTLLEKHRQYVVLLDEIQREVITNDPDYDPEQSYSLPKEMLTALTVLSKSIELTYSQIKQIHADLWHRFAEDIEAEQYKSDQIVNETRNQANQGG